MDRFILKEQIAKLFGIGFLVANLFIFLVWNFRRWQADGSDVVIEDNFAIQSDDSNIVL